MAGHQQSRAGGAAAKGGSAQVNSPANDEIRAVADQLRAIVRQITPEEFRWQEGNYDRDSPLGRELLFLIANNEWARATAETIDITRSDAVETMIKIDTDLDRITHGLITTVGDVTGLHPAPVATRCVGSYPCFYPAGNAIDTVIPIINVHEATSVKPRPSPAASPRRLRVVRRAGSGQARRGGRVGMATRQAHTAGPVAGQDPGRCRP